jgi:hypothetical protein
MNLSRGGLLEKSAIASGGSFRLAHQSLICCVSNMTGCDWPWRVSCRILRLLGLPLLRLLQLARRDIQLDQPVDGLREADPSLRRNGLLALPHPLVAGQP